MDILGSPKLQAYGKEEIGRMRTECELVLAQREAGREQKEDAGEEEGAAAVLVHEEGEASHIAEADGRANVGDDER